jgi:hypothetical protein
MDLCVCVTRTDEWGRCDYTVTQNKEKSDGHDIGQVYY